MATATSSAEVREVQLIQRAATGDGDAFALLFEKHFQTIYNYVLWLCNDPDQAEDLTQETFIRAHKSLSQLGPPWHIKPWLYRLAHNLFIDFARQKKHQAPLDPDAPLASHEENPERQIMFEELSGPVHGALVKLSPNYREALVLREVQGFHYSDIAEIMGVSVDHVKVLLHRARASFKDNYGLRLLMEKPMKPCEVLNEMLDAYRDRELTSAQEDMVREHVKDCPTCKQRKRELAAMLILFRGQPEFQLPHGLQGKLLKVGGHGNGQGKGQGQGQVSPPPPQPSKSMKKNVQPMILFGVLAAGLILVAWLLFFFILPPPTNAGAPPQETPTSLAGGGTGPTSGGQCVPDPNDAFCSACENTDLDSNNCVCNMNGVCDPQEGFNCGDCMPTPSTSSTGGGGGGPSRCACNCLAYGGTACIRWQNACTGAVGPRSVCQ